MNRSALETMLRDASRPLRTTAMRAAFSAVAAAIAGVALLGVSGWFITASALAGMGGVLAVKAFNYLLPSASIRGLTIVRTLARYGERYWSHRAALLALADVRARLFDRLAARPESAVHHTGELTARLVQDIDALEDLIVRQPALPAAVAGGAAGIAFSLLAGLWPAMALATVLLVLAVAVRRVAPRLLTRPALTAATALGDLKAAFVTSASASPEVAAYGLAPRITMHLEKEAVRLDRARLAFARGEALLDAALGVGGGVAAALVALLSEADAARTVLAMLAAVAATEALTAYVRGIAREAAIAASLDRLAQLLEADQAAAVDVTTSPALAGDVLTVSYGGACLDLARGDRLALTGPSGSGKTRILEVLAGLRADPGVAGLMIDGRPLSAVSPALLRPLMALAPQDAGLLAGTVRDNLRLARSGLDDDARLWAVLETACLADVVRALPEGLDSWIGDAGARLSGGQRKRLALARALLAGRPWLLLDEPSEGLDPATEAQLVARLDAWLAATGTGLVVATHRPALLALTPRRLATA